MKNFKTQDKELIRDDNEVLKNLFVTQEEDAIAEFELEKDQDI